MSEEHTSKCDVCGREVDHLLGYLDPRTGQCRCEECFDRGAETLESIEEWIEMSQGTPAAHTFHKLLTYSNGQYMTYDEYRDSKSDE